MAKESVAKQPTIREIVEQIDATNSGEIAHVCDGLKALIELMEDGDMIEAEDHRKMGRIASLLDSVRLRLQAAKDKIESLASDAHAAQVQS